MTVPQQQYKKNIVNDAILKEISDAIQRLAFGTVTIKINHSKPLLVGGEPDPCESGSEEAQFHGEEPLTDGVG